MSCIYICSWHAYDLIIITVCRFSLRWRKIMGQSWLIRTLWGFKGGKWKAGGGGGGSIPSPLVQMISNTSTVWHGISEYQNFSSPFQTKDGLFQIRSSLMPRKLMFTPHSLNRVLTLLCLSIFILLMCCTSLGRNVWWLQNHSNMYTMTLHSGSMCTVNLAQISHTWGYYDNTGGLQMVDDTGPTDKIFYIIWSHRERQTQLTVRLGNREKLTDERVLWADLDFICQ